MQPGEGAKAKPASHVSSAPVKAKPRSKSLFVRTRFPPFPLAAVRGSLCVVVGCGEGFIRADVLISSHFFMEFRSKTPGLALTPSFAGVSAGFSCELAAQ